MVLITALSGQNSEVKQHACLLAEFFGRKHLPQGKKPFAIFGSSNRTDE
jgi:hypothetical protein